MARDFHCGFKIAVYVGTAYVRRAVEPEGVIKFPPALSSKAAVHAATFSHFRHIEPSSGWVGCRRGVEAAPGLGCLRRLPPEGGVPGSRVETTPCPACPPRGVRRLGRLRKLHECNTCITSPSAMAQQITTGLRPQLPVQGAVLDGFGNMIGGELFGASQVGDGAGDFQDPVVSAGAQ